MGVLVAYIHTVGAVGCLVDHHHNCGHIVELAVVGVAVAEDVDPGTVDTCQWEIGD